jgi:hypothetical protein
VANGVAENISTLSSHVAGQFPPTVSGNTFTAIEKPQISASGTGELTNGAKLSLNSKLSTTDLDSNFATGISIQNGKFVLYSAESANAQIAHLSTKAFISFHDVTNISGDIWHHLETLGGSIVDALKGTETFLSDGIHFINKVGDALEFVVTIGGKALKLALDTLALVYKAMNYLFMLVKLGMKEVRPINL